ncbi:MAG: [NiFe] hydrogenase diaphorase moiety small subunit [Clostridiales bacterium]|jgi:NADH-quinone oxidoreductase subunit G/[NiFe] hydrogenase diaphorase moiety small subunit|nr:[NiFe] hydrogenase diaphorase moiety small subunit [Clostridiales bacterium]MDN5281405.1 [NiFe] hydrogenase diaphorase moiety small subunit [Candidatus Ozemobacter sp.]
MEKNVKNPKIGADRAPASSVAASVEVAKNQDELGAMVAVTIDGNEIKVPFGTTILDAAKKLNIKIPTLCHHEDLKVAGVCRVCVVEVENQRTLQAACAYPITSPMNIKTYSSKVRKARRHNLDLMLKHHVGECYSCFRNNNCELQSLAKEYGVDSYRFGHDTEPHHEVDKSSYSVVRDMNKCIHCRRCVRTCIDLQEVGVLEAVNRGPDLDIATFDDMPLGEVVCINCGQCINRCPVGALRANDPSDEIWEAIDNPEKHVVIQTAPSPRAAIGECFGLPAGTSVTRQLNTAMKRCGFDKVFDTNFTADLTIMEEATELLIRLKKALVDKDANVALPQFTSCSPGWVKYLEHFYPEYTDNLSSCKSPQQMFGALIKTWYAQEAGIDPKNIVSVALMPCSAKKFECNRPEMQDSGYKDVDYGLTSRELAQMIQEAGLDLPNLPHTDFDDPIGEATGAGLIFGATGGVMEAALRTAVEIVTGIKTENVFENLDIIPIRGFEGVKYMEIKVPAAGPVPEILSKALGGAKDFSFLKDAVLKVAVAHGTANAKKVMEDIKAGGKFSECHFIEFMACPGGCLGGGGQPIPTSPEIRKARTQAIYDEEKTLYSRKSHENPTVDRIYGKFLTEGPCGHKSHKLLHTHYVKRGKKIV